ncbi:MAG: lysophospholipid acyltransferase family protein [Synergistaceae bacterium]|nr:lysophospholipid acyltransferase family protein [Synergistaceae bacterium]
MPHRCALKFGAFLGRVLHLVLWKKVDRAEARCVRALGVGVSIAREIVRGSFVNLCVSAVEFVRLPVIEDRIEEFMSFSEESQAVLRSALARGKGVILMTTHMANWEYASARVIRAGFPLHSVYTPQRDARVERVIADIRENTEGMSMIDSDRGLKEIFRVLKAGGIVVIMQDLDARKDGVITDFLGLPASTHEGIVKLYRKFGCPVIPSHYVRVEGGRHSLEMRGILSDELDGEGRKFGEDIRGSLEMCNRVIEGWIRENPSQWFWIMDRWEYTLGK